MVEDSSKSGLIQLYLCKIWGLSDNIVFLKRGGAILHMELAVFCCGCELLARNLCVPQPAASVSIPPIVLAQPYPAGRGASGTPGALGRTERRADRAPLP